MATCIDDWVYGFFTALKASGHIPTDKTPREEWAAEATTSSVLCTQGLLVLTCTAGEVFKLSPDGRKMRWESLFTCEVSRRAGDTWRTTAPVSVRMPHLQLSRYQRYDDPWHALGVAGTACIASTPLEWRLCCGKGQILMDMDAVQIDLRKTYVADRNGTKRRIGTYECQVQVFDSRGMPKGWDLPRDARACRVQRDLLDRATPLCRLRRLLDEGGTTKSRQAMELVDDTLDGIDALVGRVSAWSACSSNFVAYLVALAEEARSEITKLVKARHEPVRRLLPATEAAIAALSRKRKRS